MVRRYCLFREASLSPGGSSLEASPVLSFIPRRLYIVALSLGLINGFASLPFYEDFLYPLTGVPLDP